jgi:class 3 adenylate cyclase
MTVEQTCSACATPNDPGARLCRACGAPIAAGSEGMRRVVTVVFSDLARSTALAESLDPESLRLLMARYFDVMQSVLERHGGVVEKFIGDAVMAVFGIPRAHEDDALRAVRAAVEMREELRGLNEEFERSFGVTVAARTGVNTGEVSAGDPARGQSFVVGEAINTAARLEQSAAPGEILIGQQTYGLVQAAVVASNAGQRPLKGIARPVSAMRLLQVSRRGPGWSRRLDSPIVGRERELARLEEAFERVRGGRMAAVATVMGAAGVGKSRLAAELLAGIGSGATVIEGRCLPYGEGITFWPIVELLQDAAGISERDSPADARGRLAELLSEAPDGGLVADRLAALIGLAPESLGIQETFWAVRRLLEQLGSRRPLVVVLDDIHWGESTFLDLVEYLADWLRGASVLIVCLTRPELLEVRADWMAEKENAVTVRLHPLSAEDTDRLIGNLLGVPLAGEARARMADFAEGNPLFIEETLRMLVDDGALERSNGRWAVAADLSGIAIPPTIHALLAARLDRLGDEERGVIERAAVAGRVFSWGAVAELSPADRRARVIVCLQSLARKELIRPDYSATWEDEAFRFTHILIRDAAYGAIPKARRAVLHERMAEWVRRQAAGRVGQFEEIVGYHLEQARRALLELGPVAQRAERLGRLASEALAAAGGRAFGRGDMPAAVNLLSRAASLLPEHDPDRLQISLQLAFALHQTGDFATLRTVLEEAERSAQAAGDAGLRTHAYILRLWMRQSTNPEGWAGEAEPEAAAAISGFEAAHDERGLARGWALLGLVHMTNAHFGPAEQAWRLAAGHARRAGDRREELESLAWVPLMVWAGPTHADVGLPRCEQILHEVDGDKKAMSSTLLACAVFQAGLGDADAARGSIERARRLLQDLGLRVWLGGPLAQFAGWVELLVGDAAAAERELRAGYDTLSRIGELGWLSTVVAILAEAVYVQGRDGEAGELTDLSREMAASDDLYSQALWRAVAAKALARRGEGAEGARLAQAAAQIAARTDFLHLRWHVAMSEAETLELAGGRDAAAATFERAIALAKRKGNAAGERAARARLDALLHTPRS